MCRTIFDYLVQHSPGEFMTIRQTSCNIALLLYVSFLPHIGIASSVHNNGVTYVSPSRRARFVRPQTSVIIRLDRLVAPRDPASTALLSGTRSGNHEFSTTVSDDGRTIILTPHAAFLAGEDVTVSVPDGITLGDGSSVPLTPWTFSIASVAANDTPPALALEMPQSLPARLDTLPEDFPPIQSTVTGDVAPGLLFLTTFSVPATTAPYLLILHDDGQPLFYRRMSEFCTDFKPQPSHLLTYYDNEKQKFYELDGRFSVVDSFACGNGYTTDLHELRLLPDGHALLMAYDPEVVDMRSVVARGDSAATVIGLVIQELDRARNVVFQWRSWDHFAITDATHENLTVATIDYVHGNALELDTDGNLILSSRHMDEITKIDRETGEIMWRWGGRHNEFTIVNDPVGFSHQHGIRRLENGNVIMFDNGNFHLSHFSRAVEYQLDEDAKTATLVWQYRNSPDIYGPAMGYAQRLPNGNTLICWGATNPNATEVDSAGNKVLELSFARGVITYRAFRVDWDPDLAVVPPEIPEETSLSQNYPNPFNGQTHMVVSLSEPGSTSMKIYDVLGREVQTVLPHEFRIAGIYDVTVDLSSFASGVYFCRLLTGNRAETKKIILAR